MCVQRETETKRESVCVRVVRKRDKKRKCVCREIECLCVQRERERDSECVERYKESVCRDRKKDRRERVCV